MHLVRLKVRAALKLEPGQEEKLSAFFDAHARPAEAYARYALTLKGPKGFERTAAASSDLKGFEGLLADGYAHNKIAELYASVQDDQRAALKSYHAAVDAPVAAVRRQLKMKEDEPPRVVLVVNLLDGQGKATSALVGEELWIVVGPSKTPDLFAVARELARARLEPLVAAKADAESAALAADLLSRAFAASALALSDSDLDARQARDGFAWREWARQVDGFAKTDRGLDAFVAEAVPAVLKESGREPAKDAGAKKPAKGK
jgi:hypothetical protein